MTPFSKILDSSRAWTIFILSFISSFEIIKVIVWKAEDEGRPDPNIFLCLLASAADSAAVNLKGILKILANGLIIFLLIVIQLLIMDQVMYLKTLQTELF